MFHLLEKLTDSNYTFTTALYNCDVCTTGIYNCNLQMAFTTMYILQHFVITWWFSAVDETGGHGFVADVEVDDLCARTNLLLELLALHDYRILKVTKDFDSFFLLKNIGEHFSFETEFLYSVNKKTK